MFSLHLITFSVRGGLGYNSITRGQSNLTKVAPNEPHTAPAWICSCSLSRDMYWSQKYEVCYLTPDPNMTHICIVVVRTSSHDPTYMCTQNFKTSASAVPKIRGSRYLKVGHVHDPPPPPTPYDQLSSFTLGPMHAKFRVSSCSHSGIYEGGLGICK